MPRKISLAAQEYHSDTHTVDTSKIRQKDGNIDYFKSDEHLNKLKQQENAFLKDHKEKVVALQNQIEGNQATTEQPIDETKKSELEAEITKLNEQFHNEITTHISLDFYVSKVLDGDQWKEVLMVKGQEDYYEIIADQSKFLGELKNCYQETYDIHDKEKFLFEVTKQPVADLHTLEGIVAKEQAQKVATEAAKATEAPSETDVAVAGMLGSLLSFIKGKPGKSGGKSEKFKGLAIKFLKGTGLLEIGSMLAGFFGWEKAVQQLDEISEYVEEGIRTSSLGDIVNYDKGYEAYLELVTTHGISVEQGYFPDKFDVQVKERFTAEYGVEENSLVDSDKFDKAMKGSGVTELGIVDATAPFTQSVADGIKPGDEKFGIFAQSALTYTLMHTKRRDPVNRRCPTGFDGSSRAGPTLSINNKQERYYPNWNYGLAAYLEMLSENYDPTLSIEENLTKVNVGEQPTADKPEDEKRKAVIDLVTEKFTGRSSPELDENEHEEEIPTPPPVA